AALACHDLVAARQTVRPDNDGLHQPLLANGLGQLRQIFLIEFPPRIELARADLVDRDDSLLAFRRQFLLGQSRISDEGRKTPAKPALLEWSRHGRSNLPRNSSAGQTLKRP